VDAKQRAKTSGLSDEASGLPDIAPGVSDDRAKSGVLDDRAKSENERERARPTKQGGHSPGQQAQTETGGSRFSKAVGIQEKRKLRAQRSKARSIWLGLGMIGIIGWSVAVPALVGVGAGVWIDTHFPSRYSWTLMLLLIGVLIGCLNAWHWVANEQREIRKDHENHDRNEQH
jgi:ATP synthase protein I